MISIYILFIKRIWRPDVNQGKCPGITLCFLDQVQQSSGPSQNRRYAKESNTYVDFALINLGGLKKDNTDAVNELTYLDTGCHRGNAAAAAQFHGSVKQEKSGPLYQAGLKIVKTGFGQPSIFNTDAIVQELVRQGKTVEDAREGGASGCVEAGAFGREAYILTGYFNLPKILEITLNNGIDPRTGKQIGPVTGDPTVFETFDEFLDAYKRQLQHFIDIKIKGNNIIERINAKYMPVPFLSLFIDDCVANGKDYNAGGARYNTSYIQGVGLGTITDSLTALKYHVFDNQTITMRIFSMRSILIFMGMTTSDSCL